jgi:streptogramin lyase
MRAWILVGLGVVLSQQTDPDPETVKLRATIAKTPRLPHEAQELVLHPSLSVTMVSSVAMDGQGLIYILQRGQESDPILVADAEGRVVRTWGRGLYTIPHNIRIDPEGNVWTVDAGSSEVYQFTPDGKTLRRIEVGLPENPEEGFRGTTDIAFAPNGDFYVSDGYQNARVLRFGKDGERKGEWGARGTGPGEFFLPHAIAIDPQGTVYVADRENLRIQRFDPEGEYLGEWSMHGKAFSLKWTEPGELWVGTQPRDVANGAEGWLMKLDPRSGDVLGYLEAFGHSLEVTRRGDVLTGKSPGSTLWFHSRKP